MAKTELEEAGLETEGMVESTATLRKEIMALSGVDIMLDENTFRSTYDILGELADKWSTLTDIQRASLTELVAGKRQGNIVSALMNNFDTARAATETALNSEGSAMKENERYMESISGKIGQFKAEFQELSGVFFETDFLKGTVEEATDLLNVLTFVIDKAGTLPTILGGIGIAKSIKNFGSSNEFALYGCESIVA